MTESMQAQALAVRKKHILDVAAQVFAEKGFHAATIREIARRAGIADGTLYNYFANKAELLLGIFEQMRTNLLEATDLTTLAQADVRTQLKAFLTLPLKAWEHDQFALFRIIVSELLVNPELRQLYEEQINQPTLQQGEHFLQELVRREGLELDAGDIQILVQMMSSVMLGILLQRSIGTRDHDQAALIDLLTDTVLLSLYNHPHQ